MGATVLDPTWQVMSVELVEGTTRDIRLRTCVSALKAILSVFDDSSVDDQRVYAELVCRLSRIIRLRLCGSPRIRGALTIPLETASTVQSLFGEARLKLKAIVPPQDEEFNEFVSNLEERQLFLNELLSGSAIPVEEFSMHP